MKPLRFLSVKPKIIAIALGAAILAGCANIPEGAGFTDVQHTVSKRMNQRVVWPRSKSASQSANQRIHQLLDKKLTGNAAVQIALLNNRDMQAVYENLGIARAQVIAAGQLQNPVVNGAVKFGLSASGNIVDLSIAQNFLDILFIPTRQKIAEARFGQAKLQVSQKVLALAGRTRRAFYDLQADKQLVQVFKKIVQATGAAYLVANRLHKAGNITKLDMQKQRALYQSSKFKLASAKTQVAAAREKLNRLMGLWGKQTQWKIAGHLADPPKKAMALKGIEKRAITASLNLAQAKKGINALGRQVGISGLAGIFAEQSTIGVAAERDPGQGWSVGPQLSLPIPLFNMGGPALKQAKAKVRQAFKKYTAMAVDIRSQARVLRDRLLALRRKVLYLQNQMLPLRQSIVHQTQRRYNAMLIGVFQLLAAKQLEIEASQQFIQNLRDYWLVRSKLKQLLAGSKPPLAQNNIPAPLTPTAIIQTPQP